MGKVRFNLLDDFFIGRLCMVAVKTNPRANEGTDSESTVSFFRSSHERFAQNASKRRTCFTHAGGGVGCCVAIGVSAVCAAQWGKRANLSR